MLVHLDTSILVDAFTGGRTSLPALVRALERDDVLAFSTLVLYEWLRGPRTEVEKDDVDRFFATTHHPSFDEPEARIAASVYKTVRRARPRSADIAIAACAIEHGAALWTLNEEDVADIPGLQLYR